MSLFFVNISHAGQKQPVVFTFDRTDDFPRAQNRAFGGDSESLLPLKVGQDPQVLFADLQVLNSILHLFCLIQGFHGTIHYEVVERRENNIFTP